MSQALAHRIRIAVVERAIKTVPNPPADARAFAIAAASRRMLTTLGIWDAVAAVSQPVTSIEITDSSLEAGIRPTLLQYDNLLEGTEPATHIVPATALEHALFAKAEANPAITVFSPATIGSFETDPGGVHVTLDDGRTLSASLLVGAEGRRSPSREKSGIKTIGWSYGQIAIVTTIAHSRPHEGRAIQHFLPGGPFALLPLPGNRTCITWSEEKAEASRILALDDAGFLAEIEQRVGGRLGALELAGPRQSWPLDLHVSRAYAADRFVIIGDAAHGVHPIAGQGVNLALRDVAALVEVLVEHRRIGLDFGDGEVLRQYERWRRFDSTVSAAAFDGLNRLFSNDNALLRAARDFGLGLVDRAPSLKQSFVKEAAGLTGSVPRLLKGEKV